MPRFSPEALTANQEMVRLVKDIASARKATPAQIALAWLLAQKPWIVPIPGTTRVDRLEENLGGADGHLTPDELARIDTALAHITVVGERYPTWLKDRAGR
jgi:aryl-alcohol dehydrogenase-like predicted oxidoreductase